MKNGYTKINLEKSKESVSRGAERILIREHPRSYKDDVANFSSSSSILLIMLFVFLYKAADSIPMAMSSPLFLDLSFTTHEIAVIYKAYGLLIMIVGGALGGVLAAKWVYFIAS